MIGKWLRHYRIDAKIGEGGMGIVYRAWDTHLERSAAIKLLRAEAVADPERTRRFLQEAKSASALNHPNIVTVYDVDNVDGIDFIAMEYIDGETLDRRIGSRGMRLNLVLKYAVQVADALTRAHAAGIVHRDLKPANVMVDKHEQVKVLDFGLAKLTETAIGEFSATVTERQNTEKGTIVGTVSYMSPEQAEGKSLDGRSDIFSFGSLLYEMVTGTRPFQGATKISTISAILSKDPPLVTAKVPGVPRELERIVSRCLRKDPERRFQGMGEVKLALEDLKEESESSSTPEAAGPLKSRRGTPVLLTAALAILVATGAGFLWMRRHPSRPNGSAQMTRVTSDSGWTTDPSLSSDSKLLAYASDRATGENLDIWVQHMSGGDAVRLTNWDSDETEPDFSPDGSRIAFRSNRQGGGIYVVPVLGGEPTLVAPKGFRPRFSPDGNWIAYWVGTEGATFWLGPYQVFLVPANGGAPRRIAGDLTSASYPIWSPDAKRLMVMGAKEESIDWWIVPLEGGPALRTQMAQVLDRLRIRPDASSPSAFTNPAVWTHDGHWIVFSGSTGDTSDLYRVRISSGGKITEDPQRITFGTGIYAKPTVSADGQLALASQVFTSHLWSLPADTNGGKALGQITLITTEATVDMWPRISPDGKKLTYFSETIGKRKLFLRSLDTGTQKELAPTWSFPTAIYGAPLVVGGTKVLFTAGSSQGAEYGIYNLDLNGGVPVLLKEKQSLACASEDGRYFLATPPRGGVAVDMQTNEEFSITSDRLFSPQFSADGQWVTFHVPTSETTRQIHVFRFHERRPTPRSEWIPVTDGKQLDREPQWSPDGNLLYFLADREGARGIYAQRLDPVTKHPVGPPFEVKMFRSARRSMMHFANSGESWPAVAQDKVVFPLGEMTGNIWLTRLP